MSHTIKVNYYDQFRCIAGECPYTCCQQWSISIDDETLKKWQGKKLRQSELTLCDCLEIEDSSHIISLEEDNQCPFLNGDKLCKLVVELGEDYLSETCMRYPRQVNRFEDRTEYTLDFGCPAVIDLINEQTKGIEFDKEGVEDSHTSLGYLVREMMLHIMQVQEYSLTERMMITFYCLLELLEMEEITEELIDNCKDRDYLDSLVEEIRKMAFNPIDSLWERNELFLDIIQIYCKQELYTDYLGDIANLAEKLDEYYSDVTLSKKNKVFEKEYEVYERLLNKYLVAEVFGSCLSKDMELKDVVMVFEWLVLEYSTIKHAIFLKWLLQDEVPLTYSTVRDHIMIICRIAGYSDSDIKEYLENSFESSIWEWGYLALIVGNSRM